MDLLVRYRPARSARGIKAVDPEKLPAARIEQGQRDVPRLLAGDDVEIITRLDCDPQDR
jgi:hypothetical protein